MEGTFQAGVHALDSLKGERHTEILTERERDMQGQRDTDTWREREILREREEHCQRERPIQSVRDRYLDE